MTENSSGGAPEPGRAGPEPAAPPPDSGLLGLVLIARFHQIPATPEGLHHQFAPAVKSLGEPARFGDQEILLAAKSLGFRAKVSSLAFNNIDNAILPALGQDRSGEYFILVRALEAGEGPSAIAKEAAAGQEKGETQYLMPS